MSVAGSVQEHLSSQSIVADYRLAFLSRAVSRLARQDVLHGKAKFGIFGDGKEIAQVALAHFFKHGDWRSGYYRDQTLMLALEATTVRQLFAQLYADTDTEREPASAGRQMVCHFATRTHTTTGEYLSQMQTYNSAADLSPVASQMPKSLGLAYASKLYRQLGIDASRFTQHGDEVVFATIGDASTSEGIFWETINAAGVLQVPLLTVVWDDNYGISVPTSYQTVKNSISKALAGFAPDKDKQSAVKIVSVQGWNYNDLYLAFHHLVPIVRAQHLPTLVHVKQLTQPQGHSTSGSHERYKSQERMRFEQEMDALTVFRQWLLSEEICTDAELQTLEQEALALVQEEQQRAWQEFRAPIAKRQSNLIELYRRLQAEDNEAQGILSAEIEHLQSLSNNWQLEASMHRVLLQMHTSATTTVRALKEFLHQHQQQMREIYNSCVHNSTKTSALQVAEVKPIYSPDSKEMDGRMIILKCMENLLATHDNFFAIGEDIGKLGGVNLCFQGLQERFGELRVTDTGIREATILGQGIGASLRGMRPLVDIQYLDYLLYCLQILSDDLASLHYRTAGSQIAPVLIRTKGHRLEGIWHSGSMMGMIVNAIRGVYLCTPRNMVQALGMYNTLVKGCDPAVLVEVMNGYRLKERLPDNYQQFTVPLGKVEVLREGTDITLVTYGACVRVAAVACQHLAALGIEVELIDIQCLLPFDLEQQIVMSLQKTNNVAFLDEDVPGGATSYMLQQVLEQQGGYEWLDAPPITITAKDHRPAYGTDGNYYSKPNEEQVCTALLRCVRGTSLTE